VFNVQPRDLRRYSLVHWLSTRNNFKLEDANILTPYKQSLLPLMDVNNMAAIQQSVGSE
jgi:hypothetical protein